MSKLFMKIYIAAILLLLCFHSNAQTLDENKLLVASTKQYPFADNRISVSMKYNQSLYKDYVLTLTVPDEFYLPNSISGGSEQIRLTRRPSEPASGSNHIITFDVTLLITTTGWNDINIPIVGFNNGYFNPSCDNTIDRTMLFDLSSKLISNPTQIDNADQAQMVVTIPKKPVGNIEPVIGISHHQGTVENPFYYQVTLSNVQPISKVRFSMYYDKADFDFITARYFSGPHFITDNFGYMHGDLIAATIVGDSLIFEINNSAGVNDYTFRLYLRPHANASLDAAHQVGIHIRENDPARPLSEQTSCGFIKRFATRSYTEAYLTINYTPGTYKPTLNYYFGDVNFSTCQNYCSKIRHNYIIVEATNSYMPGASTKNVRVNLRKNTKVTTLNFFNQYTGLTPPSFVKYKICGQSTETQVAFSSIVNRELPINQILEYLIVEGVPLAAQSAVDFVVYYQDDYLVSSCGLNDRFEIGYVGETFISAASSVSINPTCTLNNYLFDTYFQDRIFNSGEEGYVRIALRPYDHNLPGLYSFNGITYTLNPKMFFTSDALKFYIGSSGNPSISEFKPLSHWAGNTMVAPGYSVNKSGANNAILFNNLSLNNTCGSGAHFYVLAKVKTVNKIPRKSSGEEYKSTVTFNGNLFYDLQTWNNEGSYVLKGGAFLSCGGQNNGNSSVRLGENVVINYVIENAGPEKIKDVTLDIDKLSIGSFDLIPQPVGILYNISDNNVITVLNNQVNVTNNVVSISGIQLLGYNKLQLALTYKIPPEAQYQNGIAVTSFSVFGVVLDRNGNPEGITNTVRSNDLELTVTRSYSSCSPVSCSECVTSLAPLKNQKYVLSAWVKEPLSTPTDSYRSTGIRITFNNGELADLDLFRPTGPIIDGWQRIEKSFMIPDDASNIQIELVNESTGNTAFFDDIRLHPFRSNMKSFVYDPSTQRLVAELDENNYATYYEYDDEGILIRVKKETERGVMTIKESRNNQSKIFKNK